MQQGGGSGLGLVLTKGIVEQHGGCISVFSAGINTGCTFTILLPMFKQGNEQLEAQNREEASSANRRIFMNRYLEGKDQNKSSDLDLIPHGGTFNPPNLLSPRSPVHSPGHATSTKIVPLASSTHDIQELAKSNRSTTSTSMNRLSALNPLTLPMSSSANGLVGQIGTFVLGGGSRQGTEKGERSPPTPHFPHPVDDHTTDGGMSASGSIGQGLSLLKPTNFLVSNKESVELHIPLSLLTEDAMAHKKLEPINATAGSTINGNTPSIPSTLKEHLLTLEQLRILIVDDSAMNRKMLTKV